MTQIEIQNALRVLSHALPKDTTIVFEGGDHLTISTPTRESYFGRTQEVAAYIKEIKG